MSDALADPNSELALETKGRVMQIDFGGDKKLRVNYSGKVVGLTMLQFTSNCVMLRAGGAVPGH